MLKASPTKETEMTSTTSDLFPKAEPILFPTLALSLKAQIEAFLEMEMEVSKAKPQDENAKHPSHRYGMNDGSASFGLFKDKK